jgi:hypothetical protein
MSIVKKQHFVPKFYLSNWAKDSSKEQVYVYNKEHKKSYSANIKDISSSNYFYDYPKLDNEQKEVFLENLKKDSSIPISEHENIINLICGQEIEKTLSKIEEINAPIIVNLIQKLEDIKALPLNYFLTHDFLSPSDILELSMYIGLQYSRTEEFRIMIEQMSEVLIKSLSDFNLMNIDKLERDKDLIDKLGVNNFKSFTDSVKNGKFTKDSYTISIDENYTKINHISQLFELTEAISDILIHYKWYIFVNNTEIPFYTSDHPVVKKANLNHPFYSQGFSSKGIEVFFPISPKYAINIAEPSFLFEQYPTLINYTLFECSKENVIHYNNLLIEQATSQIYSNKNNFEAVEKRIKSTPEVMNKKRKRITS